VGRDIRLIATEGGELRANMDGRAADPAGVQRYLKSAFGDRLDEIRAAMEAAAATEPDCLSPLRGLLSRRSRRDRRLGREG